jgi:hypothetical protein
VTNKVHAVNVDAALTCICMAISWPFLAVDFRTFYADSR